MWRTTGVFVAFFPPKNSAAMTFSHSMLDATPLSWEMAGTAQNTKAESAMSNHLESPTCERTNNKGESEMHRLQTTAIIQNPHTFCRQTLSTDMCIQYIYISAHLFLASQDCLRNAGAAVGSGIGSVSSTEGQKGFEEYPEMDENGL